VRGVISVVHAVPHAQLHFQIGACSNAPGILQGSVHNQTFEGNFYSESKLGNGGTNITMVNNTEIVRCICLDFKHNNKHAQQQTWA
jgi:hypothetical protein